MTRDSIQVARSSIVPLPFPLEQAGNLACYDATMAIVRLNLFGFPYFEHDGQRHPFARRRALALAAFLAVNGQWHSRDYLLGVVWPEFDTERGRRNLRRELSLLRSEIAVDLIEVDRNQLRFGQDPVISVDVRAFVQAATSIEPDDRAGIAQLPPSEVELLRDAVALQHARFLEGFSLPDSPSFEDWQHHQAEELEAKLTALLRVLIAWHEHRDEPQQALAYSQRWIELDRFNEAAHRAVVEQLARTGQWSAAQRQYERCLQILSDELGVDPEPETLDLARMIRERRIEGLSVSGAAPHAPRKRERSMTPSQIPTMPGRLIGRDREIADLEAIAVDPTIRLITLVGPGGIGKTRLALGLASRFAQSTGQNDKAGFRDGVLFVELAALDHSDQVIPALANAVGVERRRATRDRLDLLDEILQTLSQRQMLIVIDNFEHVIDAAPVVGEVVQQAPDVSFLVTSRERLNLHDEHIYRVEGLDFVGDWSGGPEQSIPPAVDFFVQRARMVDHTFDLDSESVRVVASICEMLDGMPLAIELAAARLDLFTVQELAKEIVRGIGILEARARDIPARQRSMQAVFDASWEQLTVDEQAALVQLSVFRGGFTREAAQVVASATVPILERLSTRSLIRFDRLQLRFQIHELLRQYLGAKLGGVPKLAVAAAAQHSTYYCRWIGARADAFKDARQPVALSDTRRESENIRVAWDQAVKSRAIDDIDLATQGLALYLELEGRIPDGRATMQLAADVLRSASYSDDADPAALLAYTRTLAWQGSFDRAMGNTDAAAAAVQEILDLTTELDEAKTIRAFALLQTGTGRFVTAATEDASDYIESARLFRQAGDRWGEGLALAEVGRVAWSDGDLDGAEQQYQQSLSIFRELGNRREIANVLGMLSQVARYQVRGEIAAERAREMLMLARESGSRLDIANALGSLGGSLYFTGEFDEAALLLSEADEIFQELGALTDRASTLMRWGRVQAVRGELESAYELLDRSRLIYAGVNLHGSVAYIDADLADIELALGKPGQAAGRLDRHIEQVDGVDRPFELSRVLASLALLDYRRGNSARAQSYARDALEWVLVSGGNMALLEITANVLPVVTSVVGPEPVREIREILASYAWIRESALYRRLFGVDAELLDLDGAKGRDLDPTRAAERLLELLRTGDPTADY